MSSHHHDGPHSGAEHEASDGWAESTWAEPTAFGTSPFVPDPEPATGRHPISVGHLVMGVAFAGLVIVWALFEVGSVTNSDLRWLLPVPWLAAGAAGLVGLALAGRRRRPVAHITGQGPTPQ